MEVGFAQGANREKWRSLSVTPFFYGLGNPAGYGSIFVGLRGSPMECYNTMIFFAALFGKK
jgi:hypothetical protein